jgi:hypothetical protein
MQVVAKIVNALSSAETLLHIFEGLSIGAGVLTVAALIGIAVTSRTLSRQNKTAFEELKGSVAKQQEDASNAKAAQQRVEIDLATARTKQTEAELLLLKLQRFVREPRRVDAVKATALLANRPKGTVEIEYLKDVPEIERLVNEMQKYLADNAWKVSIKPVGTEKIRHAGIGMISGSKSRYEGMTVDDQSGRPKFFEEPGQTLWSFIDGCIEGTSEGWSMTNEQLPKDASVLLVGPKVW